MINNPKVSIHLSSYNHERFIRQSIESALHQTFDDFELVIKEDASTDSSWEIIQSYTDPRIKTYRNLVNREKGFNNYFPAFRGKYIAIHHSDDVWELDKLEKQVEFLDTHPQIGAVFSHITIIDEAGQPIDENQGFDIKTFEQPNRDRYAWLNHFFYHGNALCHPSILIRKECYENCGLYRFGMVQLPDFDMWVRLCLKYEIHVIQEKLVRFRVHGNLSNASSPKSENLVRANFEHLQVLNNYLELKDRNELLKVFPEAAQYDYQGSDVRPLLAHLALDNDGFVPKNFWALQLLFDFMNDPKKQKTTSGEFPYSKNEYAALNRSLDVFGIEPRLQVKELKPLVDRLQGQVLFYSQSKSWKITRPLRRIMEILTGKKNEPQDH